MTPERKALVLASYARLETNSGLAATTFYDCLFEVDPDLKQLFKEVNIKKQEQMFMRMIEMVIQGLDKIDQLTAPLQQLGQRHLKYGVTRANYYSVGAALLLMLERNLGEDFTDELRSAWLEVYTIITAIMKQPATRKS